MYLSTLHCSEGLALWKSGSKPYMDIIHPSDSLERDTMQERVRRSYMREVWKWHEADSRKFGSFDPIALFVLHFFSLSNKLFLFLRCLFFCSVHMKMYVFMSRNEQMCTYQILCRHVVSTIASERSPMQ